MVTEKTAPYLNNPALQINGNLVFGEEDLIGHTLLSQVFTKFRPQFYPLTGLIHQSGFLWVNGVVRGPLSHNLLNEVTGPDSRFYQRDGKSKSTVQFIFSGVFNDSTDWENGFNTLSENIRGEVEAGKDLQAAIGARIACPEAFILRPYSTFAGAGAARLRPYLGKRWILRDARIFGTAMRKATGPVQANITRIAGDSLLVVVDSTRYPYFTFREYGWWEPQYLFFRDPAKPVGKLNQFENAIISRWGRVISPYRVTVKDNRLAPGTVLLATSTSQQHTSGSQGHLQYSSALLEVEVRDVLAENMHSFFLRVNNSDIYGWHRQFSLVNVQAIPTREDRFSALRPFGGYDMHVDFPSENLFVQYVGQGFKGVALVRNSRVHFQQHWGLTIYRKP
jgi:hypothetical protein